MTGPGMSTLRACLFLFVTVGGIYALIYPFCIR